MDNYDQKLGEAHERLWFALTRKDLTYESPNRDELNLPLARTLQDHKAARQGVAINLYRLKYVTNILIPRMRKPKEPNL